MIKEFQRVKTLKAIRYDATNGKEIVDFTHGKAKECETLEPTQFNPSGAFLEIMADDGLMICNDGDWMVFEYGVGFYPVPDSVVRELFTEVE